MYHSHKNQILENQEFADLGTELVAYMREISGRELADLLPETQILDLDGAYWALFAANGEPLMISDERSEILSGAFDNDLTAMKLN